MADQIDVKVILDPTAVQAGSADVVAAVQSASSDIVTALGKVTTSSNSTGAAIRSGFAGVETELKTVQQQLQALSTQVSSTGAAIAGAMNGVQAPAGAATRALSRTGHAAAGVRREFLVLGHEIITGNWTRFGGSLLVLGERMDILSKFTGVFGGSLAVVAAGVAAVAAATIHGALQMEHLNDSLILTGNRAGITGDQFVEMAARISAANKSITPVGAENAISAVAATGVFGPSVVQAVSTAVADVQRLSGETAAKVAEDFAKMDDGVAKWAETNKLAKNTVSGADMEYIRTLENQGRVEEAEIYLAQRIHEKLAQTATDLGYLPSMWNAIAQAAGHAWDEMMGWGRKVDPSIALRAQLAHLKEIKAGGHYGTFGEAGGLENGRDIDKEIAAVQAKIDTIDNKAKKDAQDAANNDAQKKGAKSLDDLAARYDKTDHKAKELTAAQKALNQALQGIPNDPAKRTKEQNEYVAKMNKEYQDAVAGINARGVPKPKTLGAAGALAVPHAEDAGELALIKDRLSFEEKLLQTSYKDGEISVQQYYDDRLRIVKEGMAAEMAVAQRAVGHAEEAAAHAGANPNAQAEAQARVLQAKNRLALLTQQELEQEASLTMEKQEQVDLEERKLAVIKEQQALRRVEAQTGLAQRIGQFAVSTGQADNQQLLALEQQLENARYEIAYAGLKERLALAHTTPEETAQINAEIEQLQQQHDSKMTELAIQSAEDQMKNQKQAMDDLNSDLEQLSENLIAKPREWRQAFGQFFQMLDQQLVRLATQDVFKKLMGPGTEAGGTMSNLFGKLFGTASAANMQTIANASIAASTVATMQVGTLIAASAVGGGGGGGSGGGLASVLSGVFGGGGDYSGAFGFTSTAAGSSGAVASGVLSQTASTGGSASALMGLVPPYAQGTPYVPETGLALLHRGEAVIPAAQNSPYAGGGIGSVTNNFVLPGQMDMRTQSQIAGMAGGAIQQAMRRNG